MPQPPDIADLRARRDAALAAAQRAAAQMRTIDSAIARAARSGDAAELARLHSERDATQAEADRTRAEGTRLADDALAALVSRLQQTPEQVVGALSDAAPFALFPVRLEAKFSRSAAGAELRVRIFPDDIGVARPPTALTDAELALGRSYWRARAASRRAPADATLRNAYRAAWTALVARSGAHRASFVARASAPQDVDAGPDELAFGEPARPDVPREARAATLPDRFVVLAYFEDPTTHARSQVGRAVGNAIPDDLALAPDPANPESSITRDDQGRLVVPEPLRWLVDFDAAVAVGMGVRVPVAEPFDTRGFDRVLALGVRSSLPPAAAPAFLETLLARHRETVGCSILRSGTPTNNADVPASSIDIDQLFAIEDAPPDITPAEGMLGVTDGARLAELLGLSHDFVRRLPHAAATDVAEALAMNRACVPGTLDDFVGEFLKSVVDPNLALQLHGFFVRYVTGRGLYPALRVGDQPYGIVLTSAWKRWKTDSATRVPLSGDIASALHELIARHRPSFEAIARRAPHAGMIGGDAFARFVSIVGLLASSVEFASRKAVSDAYLGERLKFANADDTMSRAWFDALAALRQQSLAAIDLPLATGATDPLLASLVFLRETQPWRLPLIDRDPTVPLSESEPIAPYDGVRNYLGWLSHAARADLESEHFVGAGNVSIPPPEALLYVVLRYALLCALEQAAVSVASASGAAFFDVVDRDPLIANIGDEQHVARRDYLQVDAARLGLSTRSMTVADWLLEASEAPSANSFAAVDHVAEVRDALAVLANLPTARLERLFAEHLDVCSYRLDAWITALYADRLTTLFGSTSVRELHLGAFGWLENVRPADRAVVDPATIPAALRDGVGTPIYVDAANGGYIHAPSLMQAASAAVLRNGYLSHADPSLPNAFAVNLSSGRVRNALALMDGVRSGQPIAALLGYQLERGLHENHASLELDAFIYALRDRFPLLSGRLSETPPAALAETIEARNVVDGLALVEATRGATYPFDIAGLPAAATPEGAAIAAEIDRVHDSLDAVADVLMAESVHQAVAGNLTRTHAALGALTAPEAPPDPEVVRTPRSGRVLGFRIVLALDPSATGGWTSAPTPRARANPQLNRWLADHLPAASRIQWTVQDAAAPPVVQSLADSGLEPLDVVLMSPASAVDVPGDLERYLVARYRADHAVPDDHATRFGTLGVDVDPVAMLHADFAHAGDDGVSLAKLRPLLVRLRRLVTRSRASHAGDWRRAADAPDADPADPMGCASGDPALDQFGDLVRRIDATTQALASAADELQTAKDAIVPLRAALDTNPSTISNPAWPSALERIRNALFTLVPFGLPEALPAETLDVTPALVDRLPAQARAVASLVRDRLQRAGVLRATSFTQTPPVAEPARAAEFARRNRALRAAYTEAASILLGASFVILPQFRLMPSQSAEIHQAIAASSAAALDVERWLHSISRVRAPAADVDWMLACARWMDRPVGDPAVVQLPFSAGVPWVASAFGDALPSGEYLSLLVLGADSMGGLLRCGLVIDDWTETVPADREITGIAFNCNRPNALAPQALLVAVPPERRGRWIFDDLVDSVHEALDLAKIRAVEPDMLTGRGLDQAPPFGDYFQGLPAILSEFSGGRIATADFAARVAAAFARTR